MWQRHRAWSALLSELCLVNLVAPALRAALHFALLVMMTGWHYSMLCSAALRRGCVSSLSCKQNCWFLNSCGVFIYIASSLWGCVFRFSWAVPGIVESWLLLLMWLLWYQPAVLGKYMLILLCFSCLITFIPYFNIQWTFHLLKHIHLHLVAVIHIYGLTACFLPRVLPPKVFRFYSIALQSSSIS